MQGSPCVPLRDLPPPSQVLKSGDTLVLVGELFSRGYANGLVELAKLRGINVIQATVGRRDEQDQLRALTDEELKALPLECINIPLEAGFDYEKARDGLSPLERLKGIKLQDWQNFKVAPELIQDSQQLGVQRLKKGMQAFAKEVQSRVTSGNICFAHLMAGGVPRSKIVLALLNRTVKGVGDKFFSSQELWDSSLGALIAQNFHEVTANSFNILIEETQQLREQLATEHRQVMYTAYGYHGTEVCLQNNLKWQSYTPYLQGWAKMDLEDYAIKHRKQGVICSVYNCPEILTNSSSIFQGVEIPLYLLIQAFRSLAPNSKVTQSIEDVCQSRLRSGFDLDSILKMCDDVLSEPEVATFFKFEKWPSHNEKNQLAKIITASEALMQAHQDTKTLMTFDLSEVVLKSCGRLMLDHIGQGLEPVVWLGHDVIVKAAVE